MPRRASVSAPPNASDAPAAPVAIQFPPPLPWEAEVLRAFDTHRFTTIVGARQIRKTSFAVKLALKLALEGKDGWWVAPVYSLADIGYDMLLPIISQPPFTHVVDAEGHRMATEDKKRMRFIFRNNGRMGMIHFKSAEEPWKLRGKGLDFIIVDEAAYAAASTWYGSLIHTLTVRQGKALLISNPFGKNWFYELWQLGNPENPNADADYASFQFSQTANPDIPAADIARKKQTMPHKQFEREVMGRFVEDGGEVFTNVRQQASILPGLDDLCTFNPMHVYAAGMDISAGRQDYSDILVTDISVMAQVAHFRFSSPLISEQVRMLKLVADTWHPTRIDVEDNTVGLFAIPEFQALGLPIRPINTNVKTNGEMMEAYAAAIELGRLRLLNDPSLIQEHEAMESDITAGGTVRYHSPRGGHDDIVRAGILSYHAATVGDAVAQPAFVRGRASGLWDNRRERRYPGWSGDAAAPTASQVKNAPARAFARRQQHSKRESPL